MVRASTLIGFSLFSNLVLAAPFGPWGDHDITPVAQFGNVIVQAPPNSFKDVTVTVYKQKEPKYAARITATDIAYKVYAGPSCAKIENLYAGYVVEKCGFEIKADETVKIPLGVAAFTWDPERAKVDLQPKLTGTTQGYRSGDIALDRAGSTPKHLLFPDTYRFKYSLPHFDGREKSFTVTPLAVTNVDVTPDDLRATVQVNLPKLKFGSPAGRVCRESYDCRELYTNSVFWLTRSVHAEEARKALDGRQFDSAWYYFHGAPSMETNDASYKRYSGVEDKLAYSGKPIKVYPYAPGLPWHHELLVNDLPQELVLESGRTKTIDLEALNVDHVSGDRPGIYRVWASAPTGLTNRLIPFRVGGQLYTVYESEPVTPDNDRTLQGRQALTFKTSSSLYLLPGYRYTIRVYAPDDFGQMKTVTPDFTVDLTH